jgi:L-rhamnono-1,4-lactonase
MPTSLSKPSSQQGSDEDAHAIIDALQPWLSTALASFSPSRLMFGSDWPVCDIGGGPAAWDRWRRAVDRLCFLASLTPADAERIMGGTAAEAYGITDV